MQPALTTAPNSAIPVGLRKKAFDDVSGAGKQAAGVIFVAPDGDVLVTLRAATEANYGGYWSIPGGGAEPNEGPEEAAEREAIEEIGELPPEALAGNAKLVDRRVTPTGMAFHTFACPVREKFAPRLNGEHVGYAWAPLDKLPRPLHPGLEATMRDRLGAAEDMSPEDWAALRSGFLQWLIEEEKEHEQEDDAKSSRNQATDEEPEWGDDLDDLEVDAEHDGPWMSVMRADGELMYRNRNLPRYAEVEGKTVDVDDMLKHHEAPEWLYIRRAISRFIMNEGREPNEAERIAIYKKGHKKHGTPGERAHAEAMGVNWRAWSAWCRGKEAALEKGPFKRMPKDADVMPAPHRHGELEAVVDAATDSALRLALDRDSVREFDRDGRMHVKAANISKANVCPYRGAEIPGWQELGLDPDRIYKLYRAPEELEKAAPTFNGVQLLKRHVPVSVDDHQMWDIVGTTGSDAGFEAPFLRNSLFVWSKDGIELIESDRQKELSSGYHYTPDMTPGRTPGGERYDGVMRDISGNHVALVTDGRAGPDVVVGDSAVEVLWAMVESALEEALDAR